MSSTGSVTHWIGKLKEGDAAAAQPIWEAYYQRLVGLARRRLQGAARRARDEEDVALSAFDSLCRGVGRGRFPKLDDRDDLWRLLVVITARKAGGFLQHERRQKRGGGKVLDEAQLEGVHADDQGPALARVVGREPSPEFAAQVADECRRLLEALPAALRQIAVWKMEGFSNEEIAAELQVAPRTVHRKLQRIKAVWTGEGGS